MASRSTSLLALASVLATPLISVGWPAPPATKAEIIKRWAEQERKAQSVHVEWTETLVQPRGHLSRGWAGVAVGPERLRRMNPKNEVLPPQTVKLSSEGSLDLDGRRMRCSTGSWTWDPETGKSQFVASTSVFDGRIVRQLFPRGPQMMTWPIGRVHKAHPDDAQLPKFRPLFQALRPLAAGYSGYRIEEYSLTPATPVVNGSRCVVYERFWGREVKHVLWLDPDKGFSVSRSMSMRGKQVQQITTVTKHQETNGVWIPIEWEAVMSSIADEQPETCAVKVAAVRFEEIAPDRFNLPFPLGARVGDRTLPEKDQDYIIRQDGTIRTMTKSDIGKSYQEIVQSDPPRHAATNQNYLAIACACLLCLGGGWMWMRHRRAARA